MWIALPEKSMKERVETNINEIWEQYKKISFNTNKIFIYVITRITL